MYGNTCSVCGFYSDDDDRREGHETVTWHARAMSVPFQTLTSSAGELHVYKSINHFSANHFN